MSDGEVQSQFTNHGWHGLLLANDIRTCHAATSLRCPLVDATVHDAEYQGLVWPLFSNINEVVSSSNRRRAYSEILNLANIGDLHLRRQLLDQSSEALSLRSLPCHSAGLRLEYFERRIGTTDPSGRS